MKSQLFYHERIAPHISSRIPERLNKIIFLAIPQQGCREGTSSVAFELLIIIAKYIS